MGDSTTIWQIVLWLVLALILVILLGAASFHYFLGTNWDEAFYNTVIIFTTVQVELKPLTAFHKFIVSVYTLVSVAIFLILISVVAGWLISRFR